DALHEQLLFDEGHKRSVQQEESERPGHDFRADAADAALEQRVPGALPAGQKQHAKDERRLHEELREDGEQKVVARDRRKLGRQEDEFSHGRDRRQKEQDLTGTEFHLSLLLLGLFSAAGRVFNECRLYLTSASRISRP